MANEDSFISEVSDEVRRDRLYALMRRYGWIAILAIVVIVGGAAFNEWRKAKAEAAAQEFGDSLVAALALDSAEERAGALAGLSGENAEQRALLALLQAAAETEAGNGDAATAALEALASDGDTPGIYRDIATLKSVMAGPDLAPEARIERLAAITVPGNPLRLLGLEQRALAEVELGRTEDAIATLKAIVADAEVTEDLRRRAQQLIVALGGSLDQV